MKEILSFRAGETRLGHPTYLDQKDHEMLKLLKNDFARRFIAGFTVTAGAMIALLPSAPTL